jgi:hypothetical protein
MVLGGVSKIQTIFGVVVTSHVSLGGTLDVIFVTYIHQTTILGGVRFWIYISSHLIIIDFFNMHIF